jgi:hypothetical protein
MPMSTADHRDFLRRSGSVWRFERNGPYGCLLAIDRWEFASYRVPELVPPHHRSFTRSKRAALNARPQRKDTIMSDSDVLGETPNATGPGSLGDTPSSAPAGGSELSSDDAPTGNDGTLGTTTESGDAGPGTLAGASADEDPVTGDDAQEADSATSTEQTYSDDAETDDDIKTELDR